MERIFLNTNDTNWHEWLDEISLEWLDETELELDEWLDESRRAGMGRKTKEPGGAPLNTTYFGWDEGKLCN